MKIFTKIFDLFLDIKVCPYEIYIKHNLVLNGLQTPKSSLTVCPYHRNSVVDTRTRLYKVQLSPVQNLYSQIIQQDSPASEDLKTCFSS